MFVSTRTPNVFWGEGKLCLFWKYYTFFSTFKLFSVVKWPR